MSSTETNQLCNLHDFTGGDASCLISSTLCLILSGDTSILSSSWLLSAPGFRSPSSGTSSFITMETLRRTIFLRIRKHRGGSPAWWTSTTSPRCSSSVWRRSTLSAMVGGWPRKNVQRQYSSWAFRAEMLRFYPFQLLLCTFKNLYFQYKKKWSVRNAMIRKSEVKLKCIFL